MHPLRHIFGTYLSKNGVPSRTAQTAMRHASLAFTMNVHTDPTLLDVAGGGGGAEEPGAGRREAGGNGRDAKLCTIGARGRSAPSSV